ncbi:EcsC family protein [Xinfangfangia sp. CPCC 101601]|uniref:EcsC family protein n=2 Tax=Pseudogemmobacter lacusdianii TaxID=3069608 RepID=A0ABU0VVS1_9RHOB|nr:EcsC family protein [Xinfangfangia sp. CPCC 101601]MDQ2065832.1 EcsC family protein [Xinfangfangia sp. CPCC 101601]
MADRSLRHSRTLPTAPAAALDPQIAALARRYRCAGGPVVTLMTKLGSSFERQLSALPKGLRDRVGRLTETALSGAWLVADRGARALPQPGRRVTTLAVLASGAAGGAGGLATSLAEVPVTVTVILHAIRAEAIAAGFDPNAPEIRAECLQVFSAGSPLSGDDGIDTSFLSARLSLTGPAVQQLIQQVAPKLAAALSQKLAAQAVPVLGAATGAALNAAYLGYYRELAAVRFALLHLSQDYGTAEVLEAFQRAANPKGALKTS